MNKKALTLTVSVIALFVAQCSNLPTESSKQTDNEVKSFTNLSSAVLIDLPKSISLEPSSATLSKSASSANEAHNIYDGVRAYIGFADFLVNNNTFGVKALIGFWRDTLNWKYIREVGSLSGSQGNLTWTASYDSVADLSYKLVVTKNDLPTNPAVLKIDFNGRFLLPKGRVYYNVGLLENSQNDSVEIEVFFEKQIGSKSLHVAVTGCEMKEIDDPSSVDLYLLEKNGIIHISGSSYHPGIDSIIKNVKGHCYTFIGFADPLADKAIIKLGLPPSSYTKNDNALFTTYGISEMWTSALIEQEIPKLSDTLKSLIASSYAKNLSLEEIYAMMIRGDDNVLVPPSTINTMTIEQFKLFLKLNENISNPKTRADINTLLWITELTQPVYFNYIGYVGNGTTVPAGFAYLNNVTIALEALVPSKTASLTVNP